MPSGSGVDSGTLRRLADEQRQAAFAARQAAAETQRRVRDAYVDLLVARPRSEPIDAGFRPTPPLCLVVPAPGPQPEPSRFTPAVTAAGVAMVISVGVIAVLIRTSAPVPPALAPAPTTPPVNTRTTARRRSGTLPAVEFDDSYNRLGRALSSFNEANTEDVLRQPGCAITWRNGQPALQFGGEKDAVGLSQALNKCADAVEGFRKSRDKAAAQWRARHPF